MKELLELILNNILVDTTTLTIEEINNDGDIVYEIGLDDDDKGIVIGRNGRNIKSIRNILSIIAKRQGTRVDLSIKD